MSLSQSSYATRRLVEAFRKWQTFVDGIGILAFAIFWIMFLPKEVLGPQPATGGDMGSHYWPLVTLVNHGLPQGVLRVWNPGNLGGEPHLLHYFPLPYLLMALFSFFMPLGSAFNIGTILPLGMLPISVYLGVRLMGYRFPAPIIAGAFTLPFLYNESFSIWGGNALSLMSGQFAHLYALNFLFLGLGLLSRELRRRSFPLGSSLAIAGVALSHAYVLLGIPIFFLILLFSGGVRGVRPRFGILVQSGVLSILLSAWFLVPMLDNSRWNTAYFFSWQSSSFMAEFVPAIFYPTVFVLQSCFLLLLLRLILWPTLGFFTTMIRDRRKQERKRFVRSLLVWMSAIGLYIFYYFVFPALGLVDVRALPQVQLFACVLCALLLSQTLNWSRATAFILPLPLVFLSLWWTERHVSKFPEWAKWNYSGWEAKSAYPDLKNLSQSLAGNFSMPRVIYEQSMRNNRAGTERVFEMLPFFAGRATLESVYMQASVLAPAAFLLQSEISKEPSCPFTQYDCSPLNIAAAESRLRLLGVGAIILISDEAITQARQADYLLEQGVFGDWHVFQLRNQPSLVSVLNGNVQLVTDPNVAKPYTRKVPKADDWAQVVRVPLTAGDWKNIFYQWLRSYFPTKPFVLGEEGTPQARNAFLRAAQAEVGIQCDPQVKVNFNSLELMTPCPGRAHYLKFSYHPSWEADTGDEVLLISPGYLALVPSQSRVVLTFGHSQLWTISGWVSALVTLSLAIYVLMGFRGSRGE